MSSSQCSYKWERTEYERIKAMVESGDRLTEAEQEIYDRVQLKNARDKERERAERAEYKRIKPKVESGEPLTEAEKKVYGRVLRKNARDKERERAERAEYKRIKPKVKSGEPLTEDEKKVYGRVLRKNERSKERLERQRAERVENKRVKLSAIAQRASEYTKLAKKRYEAAKKSNEAKLDEGDMSCSSGSSVERCRVSQQHSVGNQVAGAAVNPQEMSNEKHWCVIALPNYGTCR